MASETNTRDKSLNQYTKYVEFLKKATKDNTEDDIKTLAQKDFQRFRHLHSWYKHVSDPQIYVPILVRGEEARYGFCPEYSDKDQTNIHFHFVSLSEIKNYKFVLGDQPEDSEPCEILSFLKFVLSDYPLILTGGIQGSNEQTNAIIEHNVKMCVLMWKSLIKPLS